MQCYRADLKGNFSMPFGVRTHQGKQDEMAFFCGWHEWSTGHVLNCETVHIG